MEANAGVIKGTCPTCGEAVTNLQQRVKLESGQYAHASCAPVDQPADQPLLDVEVVNQQLRIAAQEQLHGDAVGLGEIEEIEEEAVHHDEEQQEKKKALLPDSEHLDGAGVEGGSSLKWGANNASGHTSLASPGQSALKLGANNASGRTPLASPGQDASFSPGQMLLRSFSVGEENTKTVLRLGYAEGLHAGPFSGCNPYVKIKLITDGEVGQQNIVSSVRWQTTDPIWEEEYELRDMGSSSVVLVEVWCKARFGADAFMGEVSVNPQDYAGDPDFAQGKQLSLPLRPNLSKGRQRAAGILSLCFLCNEEHAQGELWLPPDLDMAKRHKAASRSWNVTTQAPHPLRSDVLERGELGDGIALWLRFLHQLAALFLLLFLINLTSFLFYVQANALPTDVRSGLNLFAVTTIGNLFSSEQVAINHDPSASLSSSSSSSSISIRNVAGSEQVFSRTFFALLFPLLDLGSTLLFALFCLFNARNTARVAAEDSDNGDGALTVRQYSVVVSGIRGKRLGLHDIKDYMERRFGDVCAVSIAQHTEAFLTHSRRRAELLDTIHVVEAQVARTQQEAYKHSQQFPLFWLRDPNPKFNAQRTLTSRKAQHLPLVYRIERARKGLAKLEEEMKEEGASEGAEGRDTFMAFVTFKTVEAR